MDVLALGFGHLLRVALGLLGAAVLGWLGARTLVSAVHVRAGLEVPESAGSTWSPVSGSPATAWRWG